jgi:hypothetical protein
MLADSKASAALAVSNDAGEGELAHAAAQADLAARLDPTAVRALLAVAAIEQGRGRLLDAKHYLLKAVERQPYSSAAWERLLRLALSTADRPGAQAAARRLLELDPIGTPSLALARRLVAFRAPAGSSPTATGTPLSPAYALPLGAAAPGIAAPGSAAVAPPPGSAAPSAPATGAAAPAAPPPTPSAPAPKKPSTPKSSTAAPTPGTPPPDTPTPSTPPPTASAPGAASSGSAGP